MKGVVPQKALGRLMVFVSDPVVITVLADGINTGYPLMDKVSRQNQVNEQTARIYCPELACTTSSSGPCVDAIVLFPEPAAEGSQKKLRAAEGTGMKEDRLFRQP